MTLDDLASPVWWGTAVVGSILLKVVADYARKGIDYTFAKSISVWAGRSQKAKARFRKNVERLKHDSEYVESAFKNEIRLRLMTNQLLLIALFLLGSVSFLNLVAGLNALHAASPAGNGFWGWTSLSKEAFIAIQCGFSISMVAVIFMVVSASTRASLLLTEQMTARKELRQEKASNTSSN